MREFNKSLSARYYSNCVKCGKEGAIKRMSSIYIKRDGYSPLRILCHICADCLPVLLDELEVSMPDD